MNRADGRALAKTTLESLELFDLVLDHEPEMLTKPVMATVCSKSFSLTEDARGLISVPAEVWVSIYVRRPTGQGSEVEAQLDDLVRASAIALAAAFRDHCEKLQIGPSQAGYPPKADGGKPYRMERFPVRFDDDYEE
jgi:hypothetical protein